MNYIKYHLSYIVLLNKCMLHKCNPRILDTTATIYSRNRFYQQTDADNLIYDVHECCCSDLAKTTMCPIKNMFKWLEYGWRKIING